MSFDPKSPTVVEGIDDEPTNKSVLLFGRDLNKIPCFKESLLYGIVGAIGVGLITFTATSRVPKATNAAVFSFTGIVCIYWFNCRINWSKSKFIIAQTQRAQTSQIDRTTAFDQINNKQTKDSDVN